MNRRDVGPRTHKREQPDARADVRKGALRALPSWGRHDRPSQLRAGLEMVGTRRPDNRQPLPLALGDATPSRLRTRRHPKSRSACQRRPSRARGRAHPAPARAPRRRNDRLRQGLRRPRIPQQTPHLAPIRQRIESVFYSCKDLLSLERHGARTPHNLRPRIATRLLALAACITLNHQL